MRVNKISGYMLNPRLLYLITILVLSFACDLRANNIRYDSMTSGQLLDIGQKYSEDGSKTDDAVVVLSVLAKRYQPDLSVEDKINILKSYQILWEIYFFTYFDYVNAGLYLKKALRICEETNYDKSQVYLSMGIMNHSLATGSASDELYPEANHYYMLAFEYACNSGDSATGVIALINIVAVANELKILHEIYPYFEKFEKICKIGKDSVASSDVQFNYLYAKDLYYALLAMSKNDYEKCIDGFNHLVDNYSNYTSRYDSSNMRVLCNILLMRSEAYIQNGDVASGIKDLSRVCEISNRPGLYDERMSALHRLTECYEIIGNVDDMIDTKMNYLSLKDSVLSFRQIASVHELKIMDKLHEIDKEMGTIKHRNFVYGVIIVIVMLISLCITSVLYVVRKKKKIIDNAYEQLYRKNVELLDSEELHLRQINALKEENQKAKQTEEIEAKQILNDNELLKATNVNEKENISDVEKNVRYQNSFLDEKKKDILMTKIEEAMNREDIVCSNDFSSARLSELLNVPYKYLSQVINERYGGNFFSLVNDKRIKIACRIMRTGEGQSMSVEGIANTVGFKSRSAFGRIFKIITGLSPSDYMKLAKKQDS